MLFNKHFIIYICKLVRIHLSLYHAFNLYIQRDLLNLFVRNIETDFAKKKKSNFEKLNFKSSILDKLICVKNVLLDIVFL